MRCRNVSTLPPCAMNPSNEDPTPDIRSCSSKARFVRMSYPGGLLGCHRPDPSLFPPSCGEFAAEAPPPFDILIANGDSCVTETELVRVRRDAVPDEKPEEIPDDEPLDASNASRSAADFCVAKAGQ